MESKELIIKTLRQIITDLSLLYPNDVYIQSCVDTLSRIIGVLKSEPKKNYEELFNTEKACKNQVYDYILSNGLFDSYKLWCEKHPTDNYRGKSGIDIIKEEI